jgi:very-short-patch-repair endonuclease
MGKKSAPNQEKPTPDREIDALIARLAGEAHGIVTARELLAQGVSMRSIAGRAASGRLHRLHQGVYAVGHRALSHKARWLAAVRAIGPQAVLSHRSAAEALGLLPASEAPIHVTLPGRAGRIRRAGIRVHRPRAFDPAVVTELDAIPVTTVPRTLSDMRRTEPAWRVRQARRAAEKDGLLTDLTSDRTRSDLERRFLSICRRHGLPEPEINVRIGPFTVDFLWRDIGLIVEVDGWQYHRGRQAFRDDRDRDTALAGLGFAVHRFADSRIDEDPTGVAEATRRLIAQRRRFGAGKPPSR